MLKLGEAVDETFSQTFAEVVAVGVSALVYKRQDGDRTNDRIACDRPLASVRPRFRDKAVTTLWNSFDVTRRVGIIADNLANLLHHPGQGIVGNIILVPDGFEQLLLADETRAMVHE